MPVALITGAGSGIGRAAALALARAGWSTALVGRRREALESTAAEAASPALVLPADVSDRAAVDAAFGRAAERFGRLDLLFNNAGLAKGGPFGDLDDAAWLDSVAVNLNGAFFCARAAFRIMRDQRPQGGRIINNGSISAHAPRPHSAPYTATKHAMTGLTKAIALDGRACDVACGQIDIGNAATDLAHATTQGALQPNGTRLSEPMIDVEQVADAVVLMANLPLATNVQFMTIMATKMPFIGRG